MLGNAPYEFVLLAFAMWLMYGVTITSINPHDADKIIQATGRAFPIRIPRWLSLKRKR